MRILVANDGASDAGGVHQYLVAVATALRARGHELAFLHLDALESPVHSPLGAEAPRFQASGSVSADAMAWDPDVVFSHNMRDLDVEEGLTARWPVVKVMHGYFGTCIGGLKMHAFPVPVACSRRFGAACLGIYLPRRCGRLSVGAMITDYRWAQRQQALFANYSAMVVASHHMRAEYVRNGAPPDRVEVNPLFAAELPVQVAAAPSQFHVVFLGRMTQLKGGNILLRAAALASRELGQPVRVTLAGDGPQREAWQAQARELGVSAEFPGWVSGDARAALYDSASVVAIPSVWPEPFGLTGLEGGAHGAAAVAFDTGGISTWLSHGENGWLIPPRAGAAGMARAFVEAYRQPALLADRRAGARRRAETLTVGRHVEALERTLNVAAGEGRPR